MNQTNKVIIIGCGKLGASIASYLSEQGNDVILIDQDKNSFRKIRDTFSGYQIDGDATNISVLNDIGVKQSSMVIVVTDDDNTNCGIAQIVYFIYEIDHVFVRLSDTNKGKLLDHTNIGIVYPFLLSMKQFEEYYANVRSQYENSNR